MAEVTQADRDAAVAAAKAAAFLTSRERDRVSSGNEDGHPYVQAFARHRLAAEAAAYEAAARVVEERRLDAVNDDWDEGWTAALNSIAAAIRALALGANATGGEG